MKEISITEFTANCMSLLDEAQKTNESILVTRFGKPVAQVFPAPLDVGSGNWIGSMKGTFEIIGDIVSPALDESEWGDLA
jgi:prevent-host-death family protein